MKNGSVEILEQTILSNNYYLLKKYRIQRKLANGCMSVEQREVYDRGNGAVILLYNVQKKTIVLTKQFRLPTYLNGNESGYLIEACAGLLEKEDPETCIQRETIEETGYQISKPTKVYELYMSPGTVTEILYFFIAPYEESMKKGQGGGLAEEHENIEVMELDFEQALGMIQNAQIQDAKTIILIQHLRLKGIL